ncbi:MAG: TlpA disulfide reductase family protein [Bacteroidota bacterium]
MNRSFSALLVFIVLSIIGLQSCVTEPKFAALAPGMWRAELTLESDLNSQEFVPRKRTDEFQFEEVTEGKLPFTFEVIYNSDTTFYLEIINGEERIRVDDIIYGWDRVKGQDTVIINFPHYQSRIEAIFEERVMEGRWIVETRNNYSIHFLARHGQDYRFSTLRKPPAVDVSGAWEVTFNGDPKYKEEPYKAIGEFQQDGNALTGTFRTETGDYRFLEGNILANKLYLSVFDGSHAFLFEAAIREDESLIGAFWSGKHYKTTWEAKRNSDFELASPYELTYLNEGYDRVEFGFPNSKGQIIGPNDPNYQNKVRIIQILGTWCPNCADETAFLTNWLAENQPNDLEVIGLAFEKNRDSTKAWEAISRYKERFDIPYEILLVNGSSSKKEASDLLPMLNEVISYPTMIMIDKQDRVAKIHTGFSGPATSKYEDFVESFEATISALRTAEVSNVQ